MDSGESAFWVRLKAIVGPTLLPSWPLWPVGFSLERLSYGVKGKEGRSRRMRLPDHSAPQQLSILLPDFQATGADRWSTSNTELSIQESSSSALRASRSRPGRGRRGDNQFQVFFDKFFGGQGGQGGAEAGHYPPTLAWFRRSLSMPRLHRYTGTSSKRPNRIRVNYRMKPGFSRPRRQTDRHGSGNRSGRDQD